MLTHFRPPLLSPVLTRDCPILPVVIARRVAIKMMSSKEKSRLRSEQPEQRRGTEHQEHSRAQGHSRTGTCKAEKEDKKHSEDRKDSANQKIRRTQRQRTAKTSKKVQLASCEPNMDLLVFCFECQEKALQQAQY